VLYKLTFAGISFELASIWLLFEHNTSMQFMLSYLGLHALSSILFSLALSTVVPRQYRTPRIWLLSYLYVFNFFMPVVGLPCAVIAIIVGVWLPKMEKKHKFDTTSAPRFVTLHNNDGSGLQGSRVRAQLNNSDGPLSERLKALAAIQDTPTRNSAGSLRNLLSDPSDDMRMLAYGILDGKEKKVTQRILEARRQLDDLDAIGVADADSDRQRIKLHTYIAELYQELIYQDLVQGDLLSYSCDQIRNHVRQAMMLAPQDQGLWFMLGRLELSCSNVNGAELALRQASQYGFTRERLLPYLAELGFLQKNYRYVRALFSEMAADSGIASASPLHRYWRDGNAPTTESKP
jgi:hypothetical protein